MIERGISANEVKAAIKMEKDQISLSLSLFLYGQNNSSGIQGFYKSLSWLNVL